MLKLIKMSVLLGLIISGSACATRVVVIDKSKDVVRLGPNVKGSVYLYQNGVWKLFPQVKLPEGWYAGPGPEAE